MTVVAPPHTPSNYEISTIFVNPLVMLINMSLPSILKEANVPHIYKKGDKTKCANYRPISLLSNISKMFENSNPRLFIFKMSNSLMLVFNRSPRSPAIRI